MSGSVATADPEGAQGRATYSGSFDAAAEGRAPYSDHLYVEDERGRTEVWGKVGVSPFMRLGGAYEMVLRELGEFSKNVLRGT